MKPAAPIIGITTYAREPGEIVDTFPLPVDYPETVRLAGAVPVLLPPGEADVRRVLDPLDGLILSGGGDVSPDVYGGRTHETVYSVSKERDTFELTLLDAALRRPELPILCICRGLQVLNIACGGTLHLHLPDVFGERIVHRLPPRRPTRHPVRLDPESRLAALLGGRTDVETCSWHHQSVDRVGKDLYAVAWSEDGVVEALEHQHHPWCIAVQWHPEMQRDDAVQMQLFRSFVEQSRPGK